MTSPVGASVAFYVSKPYLHLAGETTNFGGTPRLRGLGGGNPPQENEVIYRYRMNW